MRGSWYSSDPWKALWIALRRFHRDSHARKNFLRLILSLILAFAGIGWYVAQVLWLSRGDRLTTITVLATLLVMAALGIGGAVHFRWEERKQNRENPAVPEEMRSAIFREAALLAILLRRLSSERLMEKELPPEIEVITRRVLLDQLQVLELRESLEPVLLDVLLAPDGHWNAGLKHNAEIAWETFEVLRWELGLGELRSLTSLPKYSVEDAIGLLNVKSPEKLVPKPSWDIRPYRDQSERFFHRCVAELMARRELQQAEEDHVLEAIEAREQIIEKGYAADYLIGAQTVTELGTELLWFLTMRAHRRTEALKLLVDVTAGEADPNTLRTLFTRQFLAPEGVNLPTE